ncbi:MAG: DNA polymerase/3'-5' exonuclease PolX [Myxococcaceae bacterium]
MDPLSIARTLREVSQYLQLKGEDFYKSRAYDLGADRMAGFSGDLDALVREGRLTELPNIGNALAEKIAELHRTGNLTLLEQLRAEFPPGILELLRLPDLGAKKAAALHKALGIGSIEQLEQACRDQRVRGLKGFGERSEQKILAGIEQYRSAHARRRLGDVLPVAHALLAEVRAAPGVVRADVAGSVRRWCELVSDVDLVASAPDSGPVLAVLARQSGVREVLGQGESKCSVRMEDGLQVDLRVLPDEDYATALHHFTGSKSHHVRLRGRARDLGLTISEWGVMRGEEKLPAPTEEALYALLGMSYVPPELREDVGEFEAALAGNLPADLLQGSAVQGVVHSHSTWSDGRSTLEDMARAAAAMGLRYLTVTDHSAAAAYAGGLDETRVRSQWEEIARVQEVVPEIRLFKGLEVDILEDGALDLSDRLLAELDVVIASVHVRHGQDQAAMTARVLRALDHPCTDVLGHPTGRLLQRRDPSPLDMPVVVERAARRGVLLEVNGNPDRLDLSAEHVRLALQAGAKLVVSADAHSTQALHNVAFAVHTARKGGARTSDVLNTRGPDEFLAEIRRRRNGTRA